MRRLLLLLIVVLVTTFALGALWHIIGFESRSSKPQTSLPATIESIDLNVLEQINEEIESTRSFDHETAFLQLIPATGLFGAALDERMAYEQMWLDEFKVFIHSHLGLEVRYYLDYIELKYRLYTRMIRDREVLTKRFGSREDFQKAWKQALDLLLKPYYEDLEDLFENNFDEIVKFNRLFNEKLKIERKKNFKDAPVDVAL